MGVTCLEGQYLDGLVKICLECKSVCNQPHISTRCISFCESLRCKLLPGHHYDSLLKECLNCTKVCGRHPAECSQHCHTTAPPVTLKKLIEVTSQTPNSGGLLVGAAPLESTVLLYSLLAVCIALLLSSLCLTLAVFVRGIKPNTSKPGSKDANHKKKNTVQPSKEVGLPVGYMGPTPKDFVIRPSCLVEREPSEDSSPTETCVCVHCFPDLKGLGHGNDMPVRTQFSSYQQAAPPKAHIQNGVPLWTDGRLHTPVLEGQDTAVVG